MKSESEVQDDIRREATSLGWRVWRNNVGVAFDAKGRPVRYGLVNDSKTVNTHIKSSDLIGIRQVLMTENMIGKTIGQFVALEIKREGWKYSGSEREVAQFRFLSLVGSMGGHARFAATGGIDV